MQDNQRAPDIDPKENSGWPVFWALISFFAVVACVDAFFVIKALSTHTGVIEDRTYERGIDFNESLKQADSQSDVIFASAYKNGVMEANLKLDTGAAVTGASVDIEFVRPAHKGHDFNVALSPDNATKGLYSAFVEFPLKGAWLMKVNAKWYDQAQQKTRTYQAELPLTIR